MRTSQQDQELQLASVKLFNRLIPNPDRGHVEVQSLCCRGLDNDQHHRPVFQICREDITNLILFFALDLPFSDGLKPGPGSAILKALQRPHAADGQTFGWSEGRHCLCPEKMLVKGRGPVITRLLQRARSWSHLNTHLCARPVAQSLAMFKGVQLLYSAALRRGLRC